MRAEIRFAVQPPDLPVGTALAAVHRNFARNYGFFPAKQGKYWLRQCDFVPKSPDARKGRPYEILVGSVYAVGAIIVSRET